MNKLEVKEIKNPEDLEIAFDIRKIVFVKEQNVPIDLEMDGLDSQAKHFIAYLRKIPIGCARISIEGKCAKLERIAIIKEYRNMGFGKELTNNLIKYCKQQNFKEIRLHSQAYISDFYKKLGFEPIGKNFFEAGIDHIEMFMRLH